MKHPVPLLMLCLLLLPAHAAPPGRVVSINLCSDQLLLMLAEPDQIASVSRLSLEPNSSFMSGPAARYPVNDAKIEQLLRLEPDLILASEFSPKRLIALLKRLAYRVETIEHTSNIEGIRRNIRKTSELLGISGRGELLIAEMDRRIGGITAGLPARRPAALFYQPRGYTSGIGTLQDEALQLAGCRNLSAEAGIRGYGAIELERLLQGQPEQLFTSAYAPGTDSLAQRDLNHPALRRITDGRPIINIDYRYWICGGPMIVEAIEELARARRRLKR